VSTHPGQRQRCDASDNLICHTLNAHPNRIDGESQTFVPIAIQDGRTIDKAQNGIGVSGDGTAHTLDQTGGQAVAFNVFGGHKRHDRPNGGFYVNETEQSKTLDSSGAMDPSASQGGVAILHRMSVRRLTPRECERLQGFPDDYLDIQYRGKPAADGPKYRALGNSFAVPVVRWIGQRIALVESIAQQEDCHEV
jgi:DNA (cytosine-5)-methyltransferase 1